MKDQSVIYDLLVIGGGINGTGIAADATGRGLNVLLCEMNDLASSTSSNSSKLIHGGLRYLEYYEFRLVREGLAEREILLKNAPHIIWPLRFRLPHRSHLRPSWMIRIGLFMYDNLAKRATLKGSKGIKFDKNSPVVDTITKGFEYSDAWVDDARMVVLNAIAARDKGANIMTRTRCSDAKRVGDIWEVTLNDNITGEKQLVKTKALVNAAGPWVTSIFDEALKKPSPKKIRLIKGSHIIVPRIHNESQAYILQNEDKRIVFVIPYEDDFSLIGTTDIEHIGDPATACISKEETDYLISVVNGHFKHQISNKDIIATYSGVRPLLDDESDSPAAVTRDYTFEVDAPYGKAPLLSVFGGKITTYRKLSEAAVNGIINHFPDADKCITAHTALPGGDFDNQHNLQTSLEQQYSWLPHKIINRYVRSYGTLSHKILAGINSLEGMGEYFGAGLYQREVEYLIQQEWAVDLEDIIWRRSKLSLHLTEKEKSGLEYFIVTFNSSKKVTSTCE
ncbi:MAG: glycerol-3-phosphate dehydrogenase [Colwellia sp.]|jgi:glycerol-3-phosphate dehydrogenase|uniref:glycerol-3-phosphate dehydrogenase n=1 Tax=Colwellia sp. MB3u-55 TaxID=2759810 RepID=UPI0015F6ED5A|nr:glycerol-3-phosphate dehydrogenase [Colwellia sp. MB3u-55]MBA6252341.1 glycerol-3-phosphate dehydrogenase [Colwellia sp. MB3u-55]